MNYPNLKNGASQAMPAGGSSGGFLPGFLNVLLGVGGGVLGAFAMGQSGSYSQVPQSQITSLIQSGAPVNYVKEKNQFPDWLLPVGLGVGLLIILLVV